MSHEQARWISQLEVEYGNLRAALEWSMKMKDSERALRMAGALGRFWHVRSRFTEGREWLKQSLEVGAGAANETRAKALCWIGILACTQGDYGTANRTLNQSLAISSALEDKRGMADALYFKGIIDRIQEDYTRARSHFEESLQVYYGLNDQHGIANALINLGIVFQSQGDHIGALKLFEEGLEIFRESGYKRGIAYALLNLGNITSARENLEIKRDFYKQSVLFSYELGDKWSVAYALSGIANTLCSEDQYIQSAQMQGVVTQLLIELAAELEPFEKGEYDKTATVIKGALGEKGYHQLVEAGKAISVEQAIELATRTD